MIGVGLRAVRNLALAALVAFACSGGNDGRLAMSVSQASVPSAGPSAAGVAQAIRSRRMFPDTSETIAILADQLPGGLSGAQQRMIADHFVGTQKLTLDLSRPIRALKPGFLVLHYHLAMWQSAASVNFIVDGQHWANDYPQVDRHEDWFWHNEAGQRVASGINKKLLMNIGNRAFAQYWADSLLEQVRLGDYDAVFADSASPALLQWEANTPPEPRFARTGARDTRFPELQGRTFIEAWEAFIERLNAQLEGQGVPLIPNTGSFATSWDSTRYDLTTGVFVEGFADPGFAESDWEASTNRLLSLSAKGKVIILENYLRFHDDLERRRYYLANYLLVKASRTYLDYYYGSPLAWYPEWGLDLGKALTTARTAADLARDGAFRRDFQRGSVIVNPTGVPVTVRLRSPMRRVEPEGGGLIEASGQAPGILRTSTVVNQIVVPARGAEILIAP